MRFLSILPFSSFFCIFPSLRSFRCVSSILFWRPVPFCVPSPVSCVVYRVLTISIPRSAFPAVTVCITARCQYVNTWTPFPASSFPTPHDPSDAQHCIRDVHNTHNNQYDETQMKHPLLWRHQDCSGKLFPAVNILTIVFQGGGVQGRMGPVNAHQSVHVAHTVKPTCSSHSPSGPYAVSWRRACGWIQAYASAAVQHAVSMSENLVTCHKQIQYR